MSVLIKGMKMPESCFYCPFRRKIDPDNIQCLVTRDVFEETFTGTIEMRNKGNCPLIELPEKHGRLIDVDAINYEDEIWKKKCISPILVYNAWLIAGEMPTILEAEGTE